MKEHVVVCGGARVRGLALAGARNERGEPLVLRLDPPRANLRLRLSGIGAAAAARIPPAFVDLVEIACYVEAADALVPRPAARADDPGWRRRFRLIVPVRDVEAFRDPDVFVPLERTLGFLSDDTFRIELKPRRARDRGALAWLDDPGADDLGAPSRSSGAARRSVEVVPFSGGLDSFAGALRLVREGRRVILVAERTSPRIEPHLRRLVDWLVAQGAPGQVRFAPLWLHRDARGGREPIRTRAFLWSAVSAAIALAHGARSGVRFFENGVVSLGAPISAAAIGARTSRAPHPQVLAGWARLFAALARPFGRKIPVDDAFLWTTKAEVVRIVEAHGGAERIAETISCTRRATRPHTHCGLCAQCIDRRFAILAAGAEAHDPQALYEVDLLVGARPPGEPRAILEGYVRAATELASCDDTELFARHGELARVIAHVEGSAAETADRIVDLHRRHGAEVEAVLDAGIRAHATALRRGTLPRSSLLVLALPGDPSAREGAIVSEPAPIPPGRAAAAGVVRVLHLSDFHFSPRRAWDQDPVLAALARYVAGLVAAGLRPDLVAITGDVADRGTAAEYALAARWLRDHLLPVVELGAERLLLVPGNHDVDRGGVGRIAQAAQAELLRAESQDAIAAVLLDPQERAPLLRRHEAWAAFVRELGAPRGDDRPWWSQRFTIGGLQVHVAGLASTWVSWCDDDKGRLLIGRAQLHQVLAPREPCDVSLALVHHPWDYLADFDAFEVREAVQRRCDVLLRGHLHKGDAAARLRPDGSAIELAAGACWGGSTHPHAYHLVELEPAATRARVHLRTWDGHDWIADRNAYRGAAAHGVVELPLRIR